MAKDATGSRPALKRATGRDYDEWFAALDEWGAKDRGFREISAWLTGEHGMSTWWAQKVIVEYQESRGVRAPGVRPDGTFTATATKTIAKPDSLVVKAFTDQRIRRRWLPESSAPTRTTATERGWTSSFEWEDGSRVRFTSLVQSGEKTQVAVEHSKLPDSKTADRQKTYWRERLSALKELLESYRSGS